MNMMMMMMMMSIIRHNCLLEQHKSFISSSTLSMVKKAEQ